ncbi:MAG: polymorphic toxin-type HINT domain-containing protein [Streptosporangiaceae bacterium]
MRYLPGRRVPVTGLALILATLLGCAQAAPGAARAAAAATTRPHAATTAASFFPAAVTAPASQAPPGRRARLAGPAAALAAEDAGAAGDTAAACGGMSFTAGTRVLLASGVAIPISQLKPGEKVLATNVQTGKTQAEPVTAVLVHHDTDRYDLTIQTPHGTAVIHTTSSHLFWDPAARRWVKAAALKYGARLRAPAGGSAVVVTGGWVPRQSAGWMWDLTVNGGNDHDFYVDTAAAAVLVHNCPIGSSESWGNPDSLAGHFAAHGADFGASSAEDYANQASEFFHRGLQENMPIKIDEEGVIRIYDPQTNTFGAYNPSGTTRTFFQPTSPTYWLRQPGVEPWSP